MYMDELYQSNWYTRKAKRVWRWNWSWKWNYSAKWLKWQHASSGGTKPIWFEGWQTPLIRRTPKLRWFKRYYKLVTKYEVVNVWMLDKHEKILTDTKITKKLLGELNFVRSVDMPVKILWTWKLTKKLDFEWIDSFSKVAKKSIEDAWGKII